MEFETRAIHVGQDPDPATGSVIVPIYQTSTYAQEAVGENKGYDYSRVANPTRTALQEELDENLSAHLGDDVRLVWVETPSNPLLNVVDIRRAADAAHAAGALLAVD